MEIKTKKFLNQLKKVSAGIASREIIEQTNCFIFSGKKIYTYNDEIAMCIKNDVELNGAVAAKELIELLTKWNEDTIKVTTTESEIMFKGKRKKAGIQLQQEIFVPLKEIKIPKKTEWNKLPDSFIEAIKICRTTCSNDQNKAALCCIHLWADYAESIDGFAMTRFTFDIEAFFDDILIPYYAAQNIIQTDPTEYTLTDGWIHFRNSENLLLSVRVVEAEYPDEEKLNGFLDVKGKKTKLPPAIIEAAERSQIFSRVDDSQTELVTVKIDDGVCKISSTNETGWTEDKIKVKFKGKVEFNINPTALKYVAEKANYVIISESTLRFSRDNFVQILALS